MAFFRLPFRRPSIPPSSRRTARKAARRRKHQFTRSLALAFGREARLFLVIVLGYFIQVTFLSTLGDFLGVTPMLTVCNMAVITICYGRTQAFWCGAVYGILMELLLPGTPLLNLFLYPASALLWSVPFADKSAKQLEYERSIGRAGRNRSPVLRIILCAAANSISYEAVNIIYIYLRESVLLPVHFRTGLSDVFATVLLTALLTFPLRRFFGYRRETQEGPSGVRPYQS